MNNILKRAIALYLILCGIATANDGLPLFDKPHGFWSEPFYYSLFPAQGHPDVFYIYPNDLRQIDYSLQYQKTKNGYEGNIILKIVPIIKSDILSEIREYLTSINHDAILRFTPVQSTRLKRLDRGGSTRLSPFNTILPFGSPQAINIPLDDIDIRTLMSDMTSVTKSIALRLEFLIKGLVTGLDGNPRIETQWQSIGTLIDLSCVLNPERFVNVKTQQEGCIYISRLTSNRFKRIQTYLQYLKYYNGPIDGIIGPRSKEAITNFEEDYGLVVTGIPTNNNMKQIVTQVKNELCGSDNEKEFISKPYFRRVCRA